MGIEPTRPAPPELDIGQPHRTRAIARALTIPERIGGGFDRSRCRQAFLQHGDAGGVAADRDHVDFACAIFGEKQFAVGGAHAVRPLNGLVHPDVHRFAGVAAGVSDLPKPRRL